MASFSSRLGMFRDTFQEKYVWVLLPILFAICFIVPNRTGATNLYRLFIVIPMILCFHPGDVKEIWANDAARWFLLLCGWMTLTMVWDGLSHRDWQLFTRELNVLALFYLGFLLQRYHSEKLHWTGELYLWFGVLGIVLIVNDWPSFQYVELAWHRYEAARGIFNNSVFVGWIAATLALLAFYCFLQAKKVLTLVLYGSLALCLAILTYWVQGRGGYLIYGTGLMLLLALCPGRKTLLLTSSAAILLLLIAAFFSQEFYGVLNKVVHRETAIRLSIWQNGIQAILESPWRLLFGHGYSADATNWVGERKLDHFHNLFISQTFYGGLVGLVLYLISLSVLLKQVFITGGRWVWGVLVVAMQAGFLVDGDRLFVVPSALLLCYLLPFIFGIFDREERVSQVADRGFKQMRRDLFAK